MGSSRPEGFNLETEYVLPQQAGVTEALEALRRETYPSRHVLEAIAALSAQGGEDAR